MGGLSNRLGLLKGNSPVRFLYCQQWSRMLVCQFRQCWESPANSNVGANQLSQFGAFFQ